MISVVEKIYIRFFLKGGHWFDTNTKAVYNFKKICKDNNIEFQIVSKKIFYDMGDCPFTWYRIKKEDLALVKLLMPNDNYNMYIKEGK